jgi:hypothetical protein
MRRRNVVVAAFGLVALAAFVVVGCAAPRSTGGQRVRAGTGAPAALAAVQGSSAVAAVTTAPAPGATDLPLALVDPAPAAAATAAQAGSEPGSGSIEVRYHVEGSQSRAVLDGPDGKHDLAIVDGVATFTELPGGSYELVISDESAPAPSSPPVAIGTATTFHRYGTFQVQPGQHLVLTCDESSCSS